MIVTYSRSNSIIHANQCESMWDDPRRVWGQQWWHRGAGNLPPRDSAKGQQPNEKYEYVYMLSFLAR
jgi:hypothetical protein